MTGEKASFSTKLLDNFKGNLLSLLTSQVTTGILTAIAINLATKLSGRSNYGSYTLFLTVAALFPSFGLSWIFTGIYKMTADLRSTQKQIGTVLGTGLSFVAGMLLLLLIVLAIFYQPISAYLSMTGPSYLLLPLFIMLVISTTIINYIYRACGQFKTYSLFYPLERGLFLMLLIYAYVRHDSLTPQQLILFMIISHSFLVALGLLSINRNDIGALKFDSQILKSLLTFSSPYILTNITLYLTNSLDIYFLDHFHSKEKLGTYYLALQFLNVSNQVFTVGNTVLTHLLLTLMAEGKQVSIKHFYQQMIPKIIFTSTVFLLLGTVILRFLFPLLFTKEFADSLHIMLILTLALQSSILFICYHPLLFAMEESRKISVLYLVPLILSLPFYFQVLPQWGHDGAAYIRVVAASMTALLTLYFCRSDLAANKKNIVVGFAFGQFLLFANIFLNSWQSCAAYLLFFLIFLAVYIRQVGFITRKDWRKFRSLQEVSE